MAKKVAEKKAEDKIGFLEKPMNIIGITIGIMAAASGFGYFVGQWQKDNEMQLNIIRAERDCSDRVQIEKEKCNELIRNKQDQEISDLKNTVNKLGGKDE